jgi:RNA polymerase sigma factor (sigma-70 family)
VRRAELLDDDWIEAPVHEKLLDLDEALRRLEVTDPQAAEVVKLRVFAGMTVEEVAQLQGTSPRTVKRNWAYARAWLGRQLSAYDEPRD